ncbi:MFS transporter, partial [Streptomyces sp. NPDC056728]
AGFLCRHSTRCPAGGAVLIFQGGVSLLVLFVFDLSGPLWPALGCLAVAGAADTVSVVTRSALVQLETPDAYRGRVSSLEHVIGVAGPELGNFRGGLMASATSAPVALVAGGLSATLVVAAVAATNASLRAYRTPPTPDEPSAPETVDAATVTG